MIPLRDPAERRAPVALVDRRHEPGHQILGGAGRLEIVVEQVEEAGLGGGRRAAVASSSRLSAAAPGGASGHRSAPRRPRGSPLWRRAPQPAICRSPSSRDRVVGGERLDQPLDPVADLKREVGRGGAGQGADVVDVIRAPASRSGRSASLIVVSLL